MGETISPGLEGYDARVERNWKANKNPKDPKRIACREEQIANSIHEEQVSNSKQQLANRKQQIANSKQQTANSEQKIASRKQRVER